MDGPVEVVEGCKISTIIIPTQCFSWQKRIDSGGEVVLVVEAVLPGI